MGLGTTRKVISVILAVVLAFGAVSAVFSLISIYTLSSEAFLEKAIVSEEIAAECNEQLDMKYKTLEAETGIPFRVFETVKTDFPAERSIAMAFQNAFGAEDTSLYSQNMVNYFNNLCTEYLDGNGIEYEASEVEAAADEAAKIFSDTIGLHGIGTVKARADELKRSATTASGISALIVLFSAALILVLYNNKRKALVYILSGAEAGAIATALSAIACIAANTGKRVVVYPEIYQEAINSMARAYFIIAAVISVAAAVIIYAALITVIKKADKKTTGGLIL